MTSTLEQFQALHPDIPWLDLLPHTGIWTPDTEQAFENMKNAKVFARFMVDHSREDLAEAIKKTVEVDDSFCFLFNNNIFIFSSNQEQHSAHIFRAKQMFRSWGMMINQLHNICFATSSLDAGFTVDLCGQTFRVTVVGDLLHTLRNQTSEEERIRAAWKPEEQLKEVSETELNWTSTGLHFVNGQ